MKTFKDDQGRSWDLHLTITAAKRVQQLCGVNILQLDQGDPPLLVRLGTDEILTWELLYALIQPQADKREITAEQFGEIMGPECLNAAQMALLEELTDFFRRQGESGRHKVALLEKQQALTAQLIAVGAAKIAALDVTAAVDKLIGPPSTA